MSGTALHHAANQGDLARLRALLAAGVDLEARGAGWTALHNAAIFGRTKCLEALLAAGASVHSFDDHSGLTPLHFASWNGHAVCVRALIAAGADVNCECGHFGHTPFSLALEYRRRRILKILLRAGADLHTDLERCNNDAWKLVDAIRKVGNWPEYVRRRRETVASVVKKAITHNFLPDAINLEIAGFVEPPGGY